MQTTTSSCLAAGHQAPGSLATVSSQSAEAPSTSTALEDGKPSTRASPLPVHDDSARRQMQPQSGFLILSLHEAVDISLPKDYKLLRERGTRQGTEPEPNPVTLTSNLKSADSHEVHGDSSLSNISAPKRFAGVHALLECDKSQMILYPSPATTENPR